MKFKLLAILGALCLTITTHAQFHIGVKGGLNMAKINGQSFKKGFDYNFLAGGFAELGLGGKLSLQPEVLFSQTTATRDTAGQHFEPFKGNQIQAKLNYLSIPLLLDLKLSGPLHLQAGPQFGMLLNSNQTLFDNGKDAFNKGDLSMVGGVSIHFSAFRLSGRYVAGLNNRNINDATDQSKWKSQAIQLSAGFAF